MDLKRLTARVAGHIEAIEVAKKAGMTWDELAALFKAPSAEALRKAVARARQGMVKGRLVPIEQLPLPTSSPLPVTANGSLPRAKGGTSPPPLPGQKIRDDGFDFD